jgi:hypothetical protein
MTQDHTMPEGGDASTDTGELHRRFGDRWQISRTQFNVWTAVLKEGTRTHVVVEFSATDLLAKLEAEEE